MQGVLLCLFKKAQQKGGQQSPADPKSHGCLSTWNLRKMMIFHHSDWEALTPKLYNYVGLAVL